MAPRDIRGEVPVVLVRAKVQRGPDPARTGRLEDYRGKESGHRFGFVTTEQEQPDADVQRSITRRGGQRRDGIAASHGRGGQRAEQRADPVDGVVHVAKQRAQLTSERQQPARVKAHPDQLARAVGIVGGLGHDQAVRSTGVLSRRQARRLALAAQGFARPRPAAACCPPAARHRESPAPAADRLGQRAGAQPLPAAVQPAGAVRPGGAGSARLAGPRCAALLRDVGTRGVAHAGRVRAAAALAQGPRARSRGHLGRAVADRPRASRAGRRAARPRSPRGPAGGQRGDRARASARQARCGTGRTRSARSSGSS